MCFIHTILPITLKINSKTANSIQGIFSLGLDSNKFALLCDLKNVETLQIWGEDGVEAYAKSYCICLFLSVTAEYINTLCMHKTYDLLIHMQKEKASQDASLRIINSNLHFFS